ncbi:MAG: GC-type dockerin domain-anchored protein [Phycisphaerales bacterium]
MKLVLMLMATSTLTMSVLAGPVTEDFKIMPLDLAQDDRFGISIDADEGIAAIGSRLHDGPALNSGAVYLYDTSTGAQIRKVLVPDSSQGSGFGNAVAIEMSSLTHYLLVGKEQDRDEGIDAGAVYVFHADTGAFLYKIRTPDGGGSKFGATIAIEGNIAVIGAPESSVNGSRSGRAFIYDLSSGALLHTLEAQTPQSNALFGCSVDISDGLVIVGARRETPNGPNSGSAYVFNAQSGLMLSRFTAPDNEMGDQFGNAVAIEFPIAIVGALAEGENGANAGAAYVYCLDEPTKPMMTQKLIAPDGAPGDEFGVDVDLQPFKTTYFAVVGSWKSDVGEVDTGAAYRFELLEDGSLFSFEKLIASDANEDAFLGQSVVLGINGRVFSGAPDENTNFPNAGSVYVYAGFRPLCPADLNNDGSLNFFDVSAFLSAFQSQDPIADFNGDGLFNFFDVSAFLIAYNAGCP